MAVFVVPLIFVHLKRDNIGSNSLLMFMLMFLFLFISKEMKIDTGMLVFGDW